MSKFETKEGRPLCRYCLKLLDEGNRYVGQVNASSTGGTALRSIYEPTGTYGRLGRDLFCTMTCAEQWANRRLTGRSVPRGKSHDRGEKEEA